MKTVDKYVSDTVHKSYLTSIRWRARFVLILNKDFFFNDIFDLSSMVQRSSHLTEFHPDGIFCKFADAMNQIWFLHSRFIQLLRDISFG